MQSQGVPEENDREWEEIDRIAAGLPDAVRGGEMLGSNSRIPRGRAGSYLAYELRLVEAEMSARLRGYRIF